MPIPAAGCSRDCSTTSRRRSLAFARDAARYDVLANWWAEVVKPTHTRLYIGVALYKVGEPSKMSLTGRWMAACRS
ncbi:family 10 glycosylhydrolase [Klebsiella pneumoniae]|uniref:family 10 glycosylhydrolase n=1 Tax=Klebsiella pneumoniae TaxID=573 RepID=UPI00396F6560